MDTHIYTYTRAAWITPKPAPAHAMCRLRLTLPVLWFSQALPGLAFAELPDMYLAELRALAEAYSVDCSDAAVLSATSPGGVFGVIGKSP